MPLSRKTLRLARGALIAALYVSLCLLLQPLAFGGVQCRVSEALTVLPLLWPEAIPGLFTGCLLANLAAGAGMLDVVFGSLASLAAAALTYRMRGRPALSMLPPVVINGIVVGWVLHATQGLPLILTMLSVALGQAVACYGLGLPLYTLLLRKLPERLLH